MLCGHLPGGFLAHLSYLRKRESLRRPDGCWLCGVLPVVSGAVVMDRPASFQDQNFVAAQVIFAECHLRRLFLFFDFLFHFINLCQTCVSLNAQVCHVSLKNPLNWASIVAMQGSGGLRSWMHSGGHMAASRAVQLVHAFLPPFTGRLRDQRLHGFVQQREKSGVVLAYDQIPSFPPLLLCEQSLYFLPKFVCLWAHRRLYNSSLVPLCFSCL